MIFGGGTVLQELAVTINQVTTLFCILIAGAVAGKYKILNSTATKILSEVLLYITCPMMVFSSFSIDFSAEHAVNVAWVVGMSAFMYIVSILLSKIFCNKFDDNIRPVLRFTMIFSNTGYMGIPLMKALFGNEGAFYGSFVTVMFNVFLWSAGFMLFSGREKRAQIIKKVLTSPVVVAMYFGCVFLLFGIKLPAPVDEAISALGDMTMPLAMLIIGGVISTMKPADIFKGWKVYYSSFMRLIFIPLAGLLISKITGIPELPALIVITAFAMPVATTTTIFTEMFDKDSALASKCVIVSTLFSIITIPMVIYISML